LDAKKATSRAHPRELDQFGTNLPRGGGVKVANGAKLRKELKCQRQAACDFFHDLGTESPTRNQNLIAASPGFSYDELASEA
jgi:hypothetical protein